MIAPPVAEILNAIAAWATARPDVLGVALIGSWARATATPSSDIDLIVLVAEPQAFRRDLTWPESISWPAPLRVAGLHDADYGAIWSRHVRLSSGHEVEFSFGSRSWAATEPADPSTLEIVSDGFRILLDKEKLLSRLKALTRTNG